MCFALPFCNPGPFGPFGPGPLGPFGGPPLIFVVTPNSDSAESPEQDEGMTEQECMNFATKERAECRGDAEEAFQKALNNCFTIFLTPNAGISIKSGPLKGDLGSVPPQQRFDNCMTTHEGIRMSKLRTCNDIFEARIDTQCEQLRLRRKK